MTLGEMLERSAEKYPDKLAIVFKESQVTFGELNVGANKLGRALNDLGIGAGDKVGIMMQNCPEFVVGVFAALKAGAASVSINGALQGKELTYVINHSDAKAIIATPPFDQFLAMLRPKFPKIKHILTLDEEPEEEGLISIPTLMEPYDDSNLKPAVKLDDLASIYYTSGTTGLPKGAMLTHVNILSNCADIIKAVQASRNDTLLTCLPLFHAFAMTACIMLPVFGGMTNILLETFLPQPILKGFHDWKVTFFLGVPTYYAVLANMPHLDRYDVSHFRIGFCGGAPLTKSIVDKFESKFPGKIFEGYGLSECAPVVSVNRLRQRKIGSIGTPLGRVRVKIVDNDGKEVSPNTVGEIVVSGPNVMKGYYKDEEATKEAIHGKWFHTGDLGYMDEDGFIFIADRKKDMLIVGGENVYPKEVEDVLTQHPSVQDAGVVGVEDPIRGEVPKAYIVPELGATIDEQDILAYCRKHLAAFKVPRLIEVVEMLPRTDTGKILKRVLRRMAAGLPDEEEEEEEDFDEDFDEDEDELEEVEEIPEASQVLTSSVSGATPSLGIQEKPSYPQEETLSFDDLLRRLVMDIPGGIAGTITQLDGLGIASFSTDPDFPTVVADAEFSAVMNSINKAARSLSLGNMREQYFVTEEYGFVLKPIGSCLLILVVDANDLNWGLIQLHFEELVPLIEKKLF